MYAGRRWNGRNGYSIVDYGREEREREEGVFEKQLSGFGSWGLVYDMIYDV